MGVLLAGVDFSNRKEKYKAILAAGKKLGEKLGNEMLPLQVTLMSEAWQRIVPKGTDYDDAIKEEVLIAATRTWDGQQGLLSKRIVRDLDDKPMGMVTSQEAWAGDKEADAETEMLHLFFSGFALGAVPKSTDLDPATIAAAEAAEKTLNRYLG
jgi:hypothetical protein